MIKNKNTEIEPDYFSKQVASARRFYRNFNPHQTQDVSVVAGGRETCAPGYDIQRNTFPYYSIEFVVGGKGKLALKGKIFDLSPGTIFTYGPNTHHSILTLKEEPLVKYFVNLTGVRARRMLVEQLSLGEVVLQTSTPTSVLDVFEELTEYGQTQSTLSDRICSCLVELLMLKISESALPYGDAGNLAFATFQRCLDMMKEHYLEMRTLAEVAEACHIDSAYLCRLFKRFGHQTPYQYLLRLRMNHAAALLVTPGTLVKEVAEKLNFDDQFHFSRTFKKVLGLSPASFVKMHWK